MSRPGSTLIQPEPEQLYVPLGPPASHYKTPVQTPYSQYNAVQGTPYSPGPGSPTRKFTPPKSNSNQQYQQGHYLSPSSQAIPVTVKSSPVCQADVSHEILRPTPRRPPSSASPPRGPRYHNNHDHDHKDNNDNDNDGERHQDLLLSQGGIVNMMIIIIIHHDNDALYQDNGYES